MVDQVHHYQNAPLKYFDPFSSGNSSSMLNELLHSPSSADLPRVFSKIPPDKKAKKNFLKALKGCSTHGTRHLAGMKLLMGNRFAASKIKFIQAMLQDLLIY